MRSARALIPSLHPGGGALNPLNPAAGRIPDAAVFGLRTTIKF
jgi:porin